MAKLNKKQYKDMLDDLCSEFCQSEECILKEFLISSNASPRLLLQLRCIEKFKNVIKKRDNKKVVEWEEAINKWSDEGYAEKYAFYYEEGMKIREIWAKMMEESSESPEC